MAQQISLSLLLSLFVFCIMCTAVPTFASPAGARAYIEASCLTTRFPALCVQSLSSCFANSTIPSEEQLTKIALSVSLYKARVTRAYMLKVTNELKAIKGSDYQTVNDCLDQINDSVDQLSRSIKELRRLDLESDGRNTFWLIGNVETWVSAAMTDASTCIDEFPVHSMSKLRATIKGKVLNVAQATSNALALFHRYAARYQAGASEKP
ncbi:PMEI domain-containing protein [Cephalotus follicularis]|uniref:PMEI domain-containing protein n=1 Tax=Cephalotus follicularis TaxID=3775 RepID=A0A1Q3CEL6_CEPFO|nr:PMEI domain-containing protein [Cephalotus follicularis]